jgi:protein-disulfide isomerase
MGSAIFSRTGTPARRSKTRLLPVAGALAIGAAGGVAMAVGTQPSDVPVADRAKIEAVVHDYILAHPEIIPQAIEKLKEKRAADAVDEHRAAIEKPYAGAWEGAANGDVTLVEFMDYACGYCRASVPDIDRLLAEDKKLKVVYRELPILSGGSVLAARVGLHAADQGRYPAYHRAMYAAHSIDRDSIVAAAAKAGLDEAKVKAILSSRAEPDELTNNIRLAQELDASGTPLFVVGGQVLNGAVGYDALKEAIAKERAKKGG